ncbi:MULTISPECIES: hypothetical protein [unclassified Streptomyces]|uniref:hypothetical protein n=1 Tax=unclassified Streptomyces TaxID=2593676 RepID=UPI002E2F515A|nr:MULTISPECIES: hypothetical protein [unclassified Streptomyces]WUC65728.1 hypothetical protein OG861_16605 [Streptomyces sp. NBC_00539]
MPKKESRKVSNSQLGTTAALLALAMAVAGAQLSGVAQTAVMAIIGLGLLGVLARLGANARADKR